MILLDTSVVSEPLRPLPDPRVIAWIDAQPLETLFLSAITVAEQRAGVALLPAGKRRTGLRERLEAQVLPLFADRTLAFDLGCSPACAELIAKASKRQGRPSSIPGWPEAVCPCGGYRACSR